METIVTILAVALIISVILNIYLGFSVAFLRKMLSFFDEKLTEFKKRISAKPEKELKQ